MMDSASFHRMAPLQEFGIVGHASKEWGPRQSSSSPKSKLKRSTRIVSWNCRSFMCSGRRVPGDLVYLEQEGDRPYNELLYSDELKT